MKRSLHLKIAVLIVYVVACTQLLLTAHEADKGFGIDVADTAALRLQGASLLD